MKILTYLFILCLPSAIIFAQSRTADSDTATSKALWNLHFQQTVIIQGHPDIHAAYTGANSLSPEGESKTSLTSTLFAGCRLWPGAELYVDPEVSGGSGLSGAVGAAGFPNGDAYRVGSPSPTLYPARLFLRQTIGLGGGRLTLDDGPNQIQTTVDSSHIVITAGKFGIADMFDNNTFCHDARVQFMNWSLMDYGAWDYPADTRGYTWGVTAEYHRPGWAVRVAGVLEPTEANGPEMDLHVADAHGIALEAERSLAMFGHDGVIRVLLFSNATHAASYREAIDEAHDSLQLATLRRYGHSKSGFGVNIEQGISDDAGVFLRASWNDGRNETWAFTEIDRSLSAGMVANGTLWRRPGDRLGVALVVNGLSDDHAEYLRRGGYGFIIGDGALNYGAEAIAEAYYLFQITDAISLTGDYQFINDPAYNKDRGPIHVFALRAHIEF
ncbi:MAG TPA: carbohydrate porin [Candidatus Kapabacteria bacterium]|nr:carbohydrate porin [Candidatus Kapabacteria bacterium]